MSLLLGVPTDPPGIDQTSDRTKDISRQDLLPVYICSALHRAWPGVSAQRKFDECTNKRRAHPCAVLVNVEQPALGRKNLVICCLWYRYSHHGHFQVLHVKLPNSGLDSDQHNGLLGACGSSSSTQLSTWYQGLQSPRPGTSLARPTILLLFWRALLCPLPCSHPKASP